VWRLAPRNADGYAILGAAAAADAAKMDASGVRSVVVDGDDLVVAIAPGGLLIVPRAMAEDGDELQALAATL
jgi:hypothetical protein